MKWVIIYYYWKEGFIFQSWIERDSKQVIEAMLENPKMTIHPEIIIDDENYKPRVVCDPLEFLNEWKMEIPECKCEWVCECEASENIHERIDRKVKWLEEGQ